MPDSQYWVYLAEINFSASQISYKIVSLPITDSGYIDVFKGFFVSNDLYYVGFYTYAFYQD